MVQLITLSGIGVGVGAAGKSFTSTMMAPPKPCSRSIGVAEVDQVISEVVFAKKAVFGCKTGNDYGAVIGRWTT